MKNKNLFENYYVHETILENINYDKENMQISMIVKYCEWQLEENINNVIGYNITFYNVSNISNFDIFKLNNEYILDIHLKKNKQVIICMDVDSYVDIVFNYETLTMEDILDEDSKM